jgi:hypothetical protein
MRYLLDVESWMSDNVPSEDLLYRKSWVRQRELLRTMQGALLSKTAVVISTHTSKSVLLPVVCFAFKNGLLIFRDNFHTYKVSIILRWPVDLDVEKYRLTSNNPHPVYFEGFPEFLVFDPYESGCAAFSGELTSDESLIEFCADLSR